MAGITIVDAAPPALAAAGGDGSFMALIICVVAMPAAPTGGAFGKLRIPSDAGLSVRAPQLRQNLSFSSSFTWHRQHPRLMPDAGVAGAKFDGGGAESAPPEGGGDVVDGDVGGAGGADGGGVEVVAVDDVGPVAGSGAAKPLGT